MKKEHVALRRQLSEIEDPSHTRPPMTTMPTPSVQTAFWLPFGNGHLCSRYEGDFLKGQIHGRGRYMWSDGGHYEASTAIFNPSQEHSHYIHLACSVFFTIFCCLFNQT